MFSRRKNQSLVLLYRQIGLMLRSGQSINAALKAQVDFPLRWMNIRLKSLCAKLDAGTDPAAVVAAYGDLFPQFPADLLRKDLSSKELGQVFYELAEQSEKVHEMKRRMVRAFIYPAVTCSIGLLVFNMLMIFVIPQFQNMFEDFGGTLPHFTQTVLAVGSFTQEALFPAIIALIALAILLKNNLKFRFYFGTRIPGIRSIMRKVSVYLLTRQLASYLATGISLDESIEQSVNSLRQFPYAKKLKELAADGAITAAQFQQHLADNRYFPRILVQMIAVGQQAEELSTVLKEFSDFYEKEIESSYFGLLVTTEIVSLLFVAGLIGSTVIGMYLPIFQLAGSV